MPSWPTRLIAGSSTAHRHGSAPAADKAETRGQRQGPRSDLTEISSHGAPPANAHRSSPDSPAAKTSSSYRPRSAHARSLSNPFPTLFGAGKRPDKGTGASKNVVDVETTDDESEWDAVGVEIGARRTGSAREAGRPSDVDRNTKTGRCMTCDSAVRWSLSATSIKCTVCSTINDFTPRVHGPSRTPQSGDASNSAHTGVTPRRRSRIDSFT